MRLGTSVNPSVLAAYYSTVLKSLIKPRNGNWNDTSIANQMITGVAADPSSYGSQIFNVTYLFNIGAGIERRVGIATLGGQYDYDITRLPVVRPVAVRKHRLHPPQILRVRRRRHWRHGDLQLGSVAGPSGLQGGDQIGRALFKLSCRGTGPVSGKVTPIHF